MQYDLTQLGFLNVNWELEERHLPRDVDTHVWASALIWRAQAGGAFAAVLKKGDPKRGDVLVKVSTMDGRAQVYGAAFSMEGPQAFEKLPAGHTDMSEADADAYLMKRRNQDPDLWVIEIEDREGRHFLTEAVNRET
ncbi:MAG: DUF1491 family protein [Pseudomonadota bacterium]